MENTNKNPKIKKPKWTVEIESDEYNASPDYSIEKKYDDRYPYYSMFWPFSISFSKEVNYIENKNRSYLNSGLHYVQSGYINGRYPQFKSLIEEKKLMIEVTVIVKKKGKVKSKVKKLKFSDELIDTLEKYSTLGHYKSKLIDYKRLRDEGKRTLFILESGEEYSSAAEFNNVRTLILAASNAQRLLEKIGANDLTNQIFRFLKKHVKIKREYFEYEIVTDTIYNIPEFNKFEIEELERLNADMANILEEMSTKSKIDTGKSNSNKQEIIGSNSDEQEIKKSTSDKQSTKNPDSDGQEM